MVIPELVRLLCAGRRALRGGCRDRWSAPAPTPTTRSSPRPSRPGPCPTSSRWRPRSCPSSAASTRWRASAPTEPSVAIVDQGDVVHMANLDVHFSHRGERGRRAPHEDPRGVSEMQPARRALPREVLQQDERRHVPALAHGLQPRARRARDVGHRRRLEAQRVASSRTFSTCAGDSAFTQALLEVKEANKDAPAPPGCAPRRASRWTPGRSFDIQVKRHAPSTSASR